MNDSFADFLNEFADVDIDVRLAAFKLWENRRDQRMRDEEEIPDLSSDLVLLDDGQSDGATIFVGHGIKGPKLYR